MPTITRRFEWDAAHRVLNHEGRCRHLHGHRYSAEVTVYATGLDKLGRVIDFSVLKEKVGKWIEENWDHAAIFYDEDPFIDIMLKAGEGYERFYTMECNPTAENLAKELYYKAYELLKDTDVMLGSVRVWETPSSSADYPS